ncbi:hypothetical protein [Legionella worsleiensis]|uniref:Uncharacterized protein n=1 Tax=Legionella worsleiensis TaxID=45076 RepID=A0A0W1AH84_9GAMM|nr:hypothetical protein [Legionella worsleiensis]KTD80699.1 hypothetical protein Lwor_0942 [Legionella worsleiensis]STY32723.1 Uncharacterised protein [Legionella worsleiensis]
MLQRVLMVSLFFCSFLVSAEDTVLKLYRPFGDVVEQIAPVITKKLSGACFTQSKLIVREDAWRCQAHGVIYDPCFVKAGSKKMEALCPQSPWQSDSVLIEVSAPLNNQYHTPLDMSRTLPWAIELTNGEHCQAIDTPEVFDSMPIRYLCDNEHALVGYLQRCKTAWSMLEKTPQGVVTVELSKAWF